MEIMKNNWFSPGNQALQMGKVVKSFLLLKLLSGVDQSFFWSVLQVGVAFHDY